MKIRIGPWTIRVRIARHALIDGNGEGAAGLWVYQDFTVWIGPGVAPAARLAVLTHELYHAWVDTFGPASDGDGASDHAGAFAATVMRELSRQGGEWALARLNADGVVDHGAVVEGLDDVGPEHGAECAFCASPFSARQVVNASPTVARDGRSIVFRQVYCDHCGRLQSWTELANQSGKPNGQVVGGVGMTKDRNYVAAFLRLHGERFALFHR